MVCVVELVVVVPVECWRMLRSLGVTFVVGRCVARCPRLFPRRLLPVLVERRMLLVSVV